MSTYIKNNQIHGRFNSERNSKFEHIGRNSNIEFWESKKGIVKINDVNEKGELVTNCSDLIVEFKSKMLLIEAATKRADLFKYIEEGVDVETRKLKYCRKDQKGFVGMCDYYLDENNVAHSGNEMLLIPMECLQYAQNSCGNNFKGQGSVKSSIGFTMPEHGCHRVRKQCRNGFRQTGSVEDFYRIPLGYVAHYRKNEKGNYNLIRKPIWRIENG
jgi:hypothetical protein